MVTQLFFYGTLLLVVCYLGRMARWTLSWKLTRETELKPPSELFTAVSIIVAVRNEENNIERLLDHLINQDYQDNFYDIIISDDHSDDETVARVNRFIGQHDGNGKTITIITAGAGGKPGKKAALTRAIEQSGSELIALTDADCTMGTKWLASIVSCYQATEASMITGMVRLHPLTGLLSKTEALEFLSLSASGAASVIMGKPLMCNGANLAFTRKSFIDSGGYAYGADQASGDDTFFMLRLHKTGKNKVVFNKSGSALVSSEPVNSLGEFIAQRKRWASKITAYNESYIKYAGLLIFMVNFMLLLAIPAAVCGTISWADAVILWSIKGLADFFFLLPVTAYAGQRNLLLLFLPLLLLYPVYALAGLLYIPGSKKYSWKGRTYNGN